MNNFFNADNPFFVVMGKAWDVFVVNMIWLLCCLPVVTIVPATTAMYYTMVKVIRRERGYVTREFFRSFKRNLKQGLGFSAIAIALVVVFYFDFVYSIALMAEEKSTGNTFLGVFLVMAFLAVALYMYIPPVLSRFDMKFGGIFKTSFFMATRHFLTTIVLLILFVAVLVGCLAIAPGIFFLPATGVLLSTFLIERVFKKYMPAKKETVEEETEEGQEAETDEWYLE